MRSRCRLPSQHDGTFALGIKGPSGPCEQRLLFHKTCVRLGRASTDKTTGRYPGYRLCRAGCAAAVVYTDRVKGWRAERPGKAPSRRVGKYVRYDNGPADGLVRSMRGTHPLPAMQMCRYEPIYILARASGLRWRSCASLGTPSGACILRREVMVLPFSSEEMLVGIYYICFCCAMGLVGCQP